MECPECHATNSADAKFCTNCGNSLLTLCPNCGTPASPGARFCSNCGFGLSRSDAEQESDTASLRQHIPEEFRARIESARTNREMVGERRVVTALFCDIKGSTSLAEQLDPEEWTEIMNGAFEHLIAPVYRYEGTVAHLLGDAVLALFGAPNANEDDPQRAVLAGLAIVDEFETYREQVWQERGLEINVRVGINTGLVVVGEIGSDLRVEYSALGDAVNVAARMEQTARPGTVQIAAATHRLVAPLFEFEPLQRVEVKGKSEPVESYRVLRAKPGAISPRGVSGLQSPLVGRDQELSRLRGAVDDLIGGRGRIVSLIGEAGLGKSRLLRELRSELTDQGMISNVDADDDGSVLAWLEGRAFSFETRIPYTPFARLLRQALDLSEGQFEPYEQFRDRVAGLLPERASEMAPPLARMMGIEITGSESDLVRFLEPQVLREHTHRAVREILVAIAQRRPTVLVFEDLHWADETSVRLIEQLLEMTDRQRIMFLVLFRPHREELSWQFHETAARDYLHRHLEVALQPLDQDGSRTLLANLLHIEDLPESLRELIASKAEGNPFYVEEVIRSLLDASVIVQSNGHWRATREIEQVPIPDNISGVIMSRLDRLDEESKHVAQAASVVGRQFDYDVLLDIYDVSSAIQPSLSVLLRRELIRESGPPSRRTYAFKHVLIQETAYSSMLQRQRREMHRRVAECLENLFPDRVNDMARHYLLAGERLRALPYLVASGENALVSYAIPEAMSWFRDALSVIQTVDDPVFTRHAYEGMGKALELTNDFSGAIGNYQEMLERGTQDNDIPTQVSAHNKLAAIYGLRMWQSENAERHLSEAEVLALDYTDRIGMVELAALRCMMCVPRAAFDDAFETLGNSIDLARDHELEEPLVIALTHTATTLTYMTRFDDAHRVAGEANAIAERIGDQLHAAENLAFAIPVYHLRNGDVALAREKVLEGMAMADRIGADDPACKAMCTLAMIDHLIGRYEDALNTCDAVMERSRDLGVMGMIYRSASYGLMASITLDIGPPFYEERFETITSALHELEPVHSANVWAETGFCALNTGEVARAEELFQRGLTVPTMTWLVDRPRHLVGMAFVHLSRQEVDQATELVREAREFAESCGFRPYEILIGFAEAQVAMAGREIDRAIESLGRARSIAVELGARPAEFQAGIALSQILQSLGRTDDAGAEAQRAREVAETLTDGFQDERLRSMYLENMLSRLGETPGESADAG